MDKIFKELWNVKEVRGIVLVADNGKPRYRKFAADSPEPGSIDWLSLLNSLAGIQEAELVCERLRFYIRKTAGGCLIVMMGPAASPAMVRLTCDLVLPALRETDGAKGLRRLFKR